MGGACEHFIVVALVVNPRSKKRVEGEKLLSRERSKDNRGESGR